ncbi:hypothetical protein [Novosphingobium sp.]|uniref:hypothetical protein n=1 Tax=Novosphingobium sp. TaxID=1874826 RepID=UPI0038BC4F27
MTARVMAWASMVLAGALLFYGTMAMAGAGAEVAAGHAALPVDAGRPLPPTLRGITVDAVERAGAVLASVSAHRAVPTVRVVFDPGNAPAYYAPTIERLRPQAYIMGQLVDSSDMAKYTAAQVQARARSYAAALGPKVDVWEVGNELNGDWVGSSPAQINAKALRAYRVIANEFHARTAVTLNYWVGPQCYDHKWDDTLAFARAMPAEMRTGLDYVLLSIYETACDPAQKPTAAQVATMLNELGTIFPKARLGIGEIGAQGRADGLRANPSLAEKQRIARLYFGMQPTLAAQVGPRFTGGYFWWYYVEDAVPSSLARDRAHTKARSLWPTIDNLLFSL